MFHVVFINSCLRPQRYIAEVLQHVALPYIKPITIALSKQDNPKVCLTLFVRCWPRCFRLPYNIFLPIKYCHTLS